jgi:hypothetical protein
VIIGVNTLKKLLIKRPRGKQPREKTATWETATWEDTIQDRLKYHSVDKEVADVVIYKFENQTACSAWVFNI